MAAVAIALALVCSMALAAAPPERITNSLGMEFVLIPAGSFHMGSPKHEPGSQGNERRHKVTLTKRFYMQTTEATIGQWHAVMGKGFINLHKGPDNLPVTRVSWFDAQTFIRKLNEKKEGVYRLPTEAEWEYACRAGTSTAYYWGNDIKCSNALYGNNPNGDYQCESYVAKHGIQPGNPAPVKSYPPNPWGLYDMSGNVWEWCQDWFDYYPKGHPIDPKGPDNGKSRARRGGSWFAGPNALRSGNRNFANPAFKEITLGFRLVRELD
jgi:formylglycine-generating enzyme required for sulfatase activity